MTEREWERMWESEDATRTVHMLRDDAAIEDAWQAAYDCEFALSGNADAATAFADSEMM